VDVSGQAVALVRGRRAGGPVRRRRYRDGRVRGRWPVGDRPWAEQTLHVGRSVGHLRHRGRPRFQVGGARKQAAPGDARPGPLDPADRAAAHHHRAHRQRSAGVVAFQGAADVRQRPGADGGDAHRVPMARHARLEGFSARVGLRPARGPGPRPAHPRHQELEGPGLPERGQGPHQQRPPVQHVGHRRSAGRDGHPRRQRQGEGGPGVEGALREQAAGGQPEGPHRPGAYRRLDGPGKLGRQDRYALQEHLGQAARPVSQTRRSWT